MKYNKLYPATKPAPRKPSTPTIRTSSRHFDRHSRETLLSLDGGGVRGIVLTEILLELERLAGSSVRDLFDWITGTSTGSYLSLAISKGTFFFQNSSLQWGFQQLPYETIDVKH